MYILAVVIRWQLFKDYLFYFRDADVDCSSDRR